MNIFKKKNENNKNNENYNDFVICYVRDCLYNDLNNHCTRRIDGITPSNTHLLLKDGGWICKKAYQKQ